MDLKFLLRPLLRRRHWLLDNLTPGKARNAALGVAHYLRGSEVVRSLPMVLKVDITPLCNLRCTVCVHARAGGNPLLARQAFSKSQRMATDRFRRVVEVVKGRTIAVSLFYLGDPLMHPELDAICRIARDAGLNVHVTTHFSYRLADDRIRGLVESGLTHLSVCVDGLQQENYERTRVGGQIDWVLANLQRLCAVRQKMGRVYPKIEVQYLKYQHNLADLEAATRLLQGFGVEHVVALWGALHNYADQEPGAYTVHGPRGRAFVPRCVWPWLSMLIKYDGDTIPCCLHRYASQYTQPDESRALGNVFDMGLSEVWNGPGYRAVRRLASNPGAIEASPSLERSFCFACPSLFTTDIEKTARWGHSYRFEDLYALGGDGVPVRRPGPESPEALESPEARDTGRGVC